jgi:hypothetical protein
MQRNASSVLVGKPDERRLLGMPINRWDFDIKMDLEGKAREGIDCILWFRGGIGGIASLILNHGTSRFSRVSLGKESRY